MPKRAEMAKAEKGRATAAADREEPNAEIQASWARAFAKVRESIGAPQEPSPLGLRVPPTLKKLLDAAADHNGHSQSREAEQRLWQTFEHERYLGHLMDEALSFVHGNQVAGLLLLLGRVMHRAGAMAAEDSQRPNNVHGELDWTADPYAFDQALKAAVAALEAFRPDGDPAVLQHNKLPAVQNFRRYLGADTATAALMGIRGDFEDRRTSDEAKSFYARARFLLGDLVDRIRLPLRPGRERKDDR